MTSTRQGRKWKWTRQKSSKRTFLRVSRGRWLRLAQEVPINLLRGWGGGIPVPCDWRSFKSRPSRLVERQVNTRHHGRWKREKRRRLTCDSLWAELKSTGELFSWILLIWAAAVSKDRSSPRKSLEYWTERRMGFCHNQLFKIARTHCTAHTTQMKATRRSAIGLFAPKLEGWRPIFVSGSV